MENNIDKIYDNMISSADKALEDISNGKDPEKVMNNIIAFNQLSTELDDMKNLDTGITTTAHTSDSDEMTITPKGEVVMTSYDPKNGEQKVVDTFSEESIKRISSNQFESFAANNDCSIENIAQSESIKELKDATKIALLIKKRMNGESFNYYDELPDTFKAEVNKLVMNSNKNKGKPLSKNYVARLFIDDMVDEYKKENQNDLAFDIDTMLSGFDKEVESVYNEASNELGNLMIDFDEDRKDKIDKAIKKCEEEGNTEGVEKLNTIKNTLSKAFDLKEFSEFCSTCKIKNYDLKKPSRIYGYLNNKYINHKNTINDISSCPYILDRHLTEFTTEQNTMLCLAFCKYCRNMDPDNMEDHTFIYYFIRNIILIDRINIKGNNYDNMDERSKKFYDEFTSNLRLCISNLIKRNEH